MTCLKAIAYVLLKLGIYQNIEEVELPNGQIEIIYVYPKGHEPTKEERERVRKEYFEKQKEVK